MLNSGFGVIVRRSLFKSSFMQWLRFLLFPALAVALVWACLLLPQSAIVARNPGTHECVCLVAVVTSPVTRGFAVGHDVPTGYVARVLAARTTLVRRGAHWPRCCERESTIRTRCIVKPFVR